MGRISVDYIKPGMVLGEDLKSAEGRLILKKGAILSLHHLRVLKIWGITTAEIEGVPEDFRPSPVEVVDPEVLKAAEQIMEDRFSLANQDQPFIQELCRMSTWRLAQRMVRGQETEKPTLFPEGKVPPTPESRSSSIPVVSGPEALIRGDVTLASLPEVFLEISKVINDPRSSATHVADVISKDTNLSAKLLRIVNSAFYGFPSQISTISRAVTIVGSKQLSILALGTSVIAIFEGIPPALVNMRSFWEHSLACGIAARIMASYKNIPNTERLFVAGVLHDLGRILLYKNLPHKGKEILLLAQQTPCLLRSAETQILGFDHGQIGGALMEKWKLPSVLENVVRYHHQPLLGQSTQEASLICLADVLVHGLGLGSSGEHFVPALPPGVWEEVGLPKEILHPIVPFLDHQMEEMKHYFFNGN